MAEQVIAVDLGGTHIRGALVGRDGEVLRRSALPTDAVEGPSAVIERIVQVIDDVAIESGADTPVGIASPGPLDPRSGIILFTPNLPGWRDVRLVEHVVARTRRQVALQNDGNCGALGEAYFGSARGVDDLVYLALGTGIGGGVLSSGVLIDGVRGFGAEVGHVVVALDGPRCTCGSVGCLEAFASGWAIQRDAELVATTADGDRMNDLANGGAIHAGIVAAAAAEGDLAATRILERSGWALGAAIGAFTNIFNPSMVIIGGGVAAIGEALIGPARAAIPQHAFIDMRREMVVEYSSLGSDTNLLGAAALAIRTFLDD